MTSPTSSHHPSTIESLIARQVRLWENARKEREAKAEDVSPPPCITVSREFGAGGLAIAEEVAKQLGYTLWDHQIVHSIAERSGVRESLLASLDERSRRGVRAFVDSLVGRDDARLAYAKQLGEVVRAIAEHGSAVIVGRGASAIVDPAEALRVRVVMSREARIAGYAAREGLSEAEATKVVDETEAAREAFLLEHFGVSKASETDYDLVINRDGFDVEGAATVVVAAYRARFESEKSRGER